MRRIRRHNSIYRKRRRIRINCKRATLSLMIVLVILLFTTKISRQIFAKGYQNNDENIKSNQEIAAYKDEENDSDSETYIPIEDNIQIDNREFESTEETNVEDMDKVDSKEKEEQKEGSDEKEESDSVEEVDKSNESKEPKDYKEIFKSDVFIGDSITDSLSFYKFLDKSNVVAKMGLTAKKAVTMIDNIVEKEPENIFILFGTNDILNGGDNKKFAGEYSELIQAIKSRLPDVNIYINSILPVEEKVKNKKPLLTNENIDNFNDALVEMAEEEEGIKYLNISPIVEQDLSLFEPDGIHMKYRFYESWLDFLIKNTKEDSE